MEYEFSSPTKDQKISYKDIMLQHLKKILELSTNEFRGGYWEKQIKGNFTEEVYVPDSRKSIFINIKYNWFCFFFFSNSSFS